MNTWRELADLFIRDPAPFWYVIAAWGGSLGFVAWLSYWLRGEYAKGKTEGLEQRLLGLLEQHAYLQKRADNAEKAYEAEKQSRANHEPPAVIEQSSQSTQKAFRELRTANTDFRITTSIVQKALEDIRRWKN